MRLEEDDVVELEVVDLVLREAVDRFELLVDLRLRSLDAVELEALGLFEPLSRVDPCDAFCLATCSS